MRRRLPSPSALRRHRVVMVLLVVAVAVRTLAAVSLQPGLELYGDSYSYLRNAQHVQPFWFHPLAYPVFLRLLWWMHYTVAVVIVQHVLGLLVGVTIYLVVQRGGVRPWVAAVAAAPVLLDGYEIDVEQFVLSDTLFLVLLVLAVALLLVPERPSALVSAGAGLALAAAALTRGLGAAVLLPLVVYLLVRRVGWRQVLALAAATLLPLAAYMVWFHAHYGSYALETTDGLWLYGHTATFARCDLLPAKERPLCPAAAISRRVSSEWYTWSKDSPLYRHYPWEQRPAAGRRFAIDVIEAQPLGYLRTTAVSMARDFEPLRGVASWAWPVEAWHMAPVLHPNRTNVERAAMTLAESRHRLVVPFPRAMNTSPAADVLARYQDVVYTWGPTLLIALVLPVVAVVNPRTRRRRTTAVALTLAATGGLLLLIPSLTVTQDYRYVLPAQAPLWPAAALAATALWSGPRTQPRGDVAALGSEVQRTVDERMQPG